MTPFLVAVMGVPAPTAVGTDLTFATLTKLTGSFQHFRQRSVNVEIAVFLGMGSIPAGLLGVGTLEWIKGSFDPARVESIMITIIAATLVLVGLSLIYRDYFMPERRKGPKPGKWTGKGRMSRRRRAYRPIRGPRRLPGRAHLHRLGERDGRHTASSLSHSAGRYSRHGYHTCDGPLVRRWHSPHDAGQRRLRPGRDPVVGQHPRCPYREPDGALDPRQAAQADTGHHADLRRCAPASRGLTTGFSLQTSGLPDHATVDEEGASRGVGGGVRSQVDGHGGDILGTPDLAKGNLREQFLSLLGMFVEILVNRGLDGAWSDVVYGDAVLGQLDGDSPHQHPDALFGRAVGRIGRHRQVLVHRGDVDDAPPIAL